MSLLFLKKTIFLYNAIEKGWQVKKRGNNYIFKKKHGNNKLYFNDDYLSTFMKENLDIEQLIKQLM